MSTGIDRRSRAEDSRAHENLDRVEYQYKNPSQLPVPTSHPERHHRWIATEGVESTTLRNVYKRRVSGYVFANHEDYPEFDVLSFGQDKPTGPIRFAELTLAYNSKEYVKARNAAQARETADQVAAQQLQAAVEAGMRGKLIVTERKSEGERARARFDAD